MVTTSSSLEKNSFKSFLTPTPTMQQFPRVNKVAIVRSRMNSSVLFVRHTHVIIKFTDSKWLSFTTGNVARDSARAINHPAKEEQNLRNL